MHARLVEAVQAVARLFDLLDNQHGGDALHDVAETFPRKKGAVKVKEFKHVRFIQLPFCSVKNKTLFIV